MILESVLKTSINITGILEGKEKEKGLEAFFLITRNFSKQMKDFKPHIQLVQ